MKTKAYTDYFWFYTPEKRAPVHITDRVRDVVNVLGIG